MTNPWRGEVPIILAGESYTLRPTFQALAEIEQALDRSVFALLDDMAEGMLCLRHMVPILQCGLKAAGTVWTKERVEDKLGQSNVMQCMHSVQCFLLRGLGMDVQPVQPPREGA